MQLLISLGAHPGKTKERYFLLVLKASRSLFRSSIRIITNNHLLVFDERAPRGTSSVQHYQG